MLIPVQFVLGFLLVLPMYVYKYEFIYVLLVYEFIQVHKCETLVYNYYIQKINDNETNFTDN